jgi:isomerase DpgB
VVTGDSVLRIDGAAPLSAGSVAAVAELCDRVEDLRGAAARVVVEVSGAPSGDWAAGLSVGLVSKWERALRRLERLPALLVAVADGECGGSALDAFLTADHRIATASTRLVLASADGAPWPGMALYRLGRHTAQAAALRRMALLGLPMSAQDAARASLVHEVVGDAAAALAGPNASVRGLDGAELAIRRQLLFDASTTGFEEALGAHLAACDRTLRRVAAEPLS